MDGGSDTILYLEGSDQHRGWFILAARNLRHAGPRALRGGRHPRLHAGRARPQDVEVARQHDRAAGRDQESGADILRLWVASADYWEDQRIGPEILKKTVETYRKLRNTIRWMLGNLAHFHENERVRPERMPELER